MATVQSQIVTGSLTGSRDSIGFVLRLGRALHTYGYPAHRLEEVLSLVSERLRLTGQFFSTPTSIFASFGAQEEQQTFLMRVSPGEVNLGKLAELDDVTTSVLRGSLDPAEGSSRIDVVLAAASRYGSVLRTIAYGMASAAASRFLNGGWKEIGVSGAIGLVIGLLAVFVEKYPAWSRVFEPVAAFTASALAAALSFAVGPYAVSNATLAGLIVLMPGLTLTAAMIELSSQHLSSGTSRLSGAFVIFIGMGFGVAVGDTVAQQLFGHPQIARAVPLPSWTEPIALVAMPLAFTVLLRAHWRDAVWIVLAGALAVGGAKLGARLLGPELGVFLGALTVGVASNWYSRLLDHPAIITQVPGILLLVPGSVGFRGLAALLDRQIVSGVDTTFKMVLTAMALVAGTLIANIVVPSRREL
ncbi:MAG TPA: threonine/serine exporter family protein [Blastocatellia bacterium]|nr:threonine/serine exporter family protein [Blastocatellia bacterium]HMV83390.1 threonine/serine exporter family protein [Blastocatellia bacterium]HMX30117.1 threonine/serine exporter family protein [Blastocatellia bacterium]HMY70366.1 threonine/serine exporter family protein [Blastocatellia bacterium]HMZ18564.1 threonine/serine exporter family protein [Blastocatellia bacterium]